MHHNEIIGMRCTFLSFFICYSNNLVPLIENAKKRKKIKKSPKHPLINLFICLFYFVFYINFGLYSRRQINDAHRLWRNGIPIQSGPPRVRSTSPIYSPHLLIYNVHQRMDAADSLTRSGTSPPNLDRSIEDRRPSVIAYLSPGRAARRRSFPAVADHRLAPLGDTLPKSRTWDYLHEPNDLANTTVVLVPRIEAPWSPTTVAPEHGDFTDSGEEFPGTQCTTSRLLPRAAFSWTAQTLDDRIRAWVALPAAIYGGGWSLCGAQRLSYERCSSGSGKMGREEGVVKGVLMGTITGRSWARQLRGLWRGGFGRPPCARGDGRWGTTRWSDTRAAEPRTRDESGIEPAG
jgi:hypothetical protein